MLMLYMSLIETEEEKDKFEELYYQYRKLMYYCAKQILKNDELAEDAVHDAFLKIIRFLDKISDVKCNKTKRFVVIIVESIAKDIYKKNRRLMGVPWEEFEEVYGFSYNLEGNDFSEVEKAILKLPVTYRQVFLLKYSVGYNNKEIAQILNIKEGLVRQRIARGIEKLRVIIAEEG